jgi:hypothetical protein
MYVSHIDLHTYKHDIDLHTYKHDIMIFMLSCLIRLF